MIGKEKIFSSRGYIWSRTIPLLKKYIVLGCGQDAFTLAFPNYDYFGKELYGYSAMLITKPHNLFLQIMCQDGVVAGILCFFAWILYLIRAIRKNWKEGEKGFAEIGVMVGILGFLIMGMLNDSSVAVTPLFWLLFGYGLRRNREN